MSLRATTVTPAQEQQLQHLVYRSKKPFRLSIVDFYNPCHYVCTLRAKNDQRLKGYITAVL